MSGAILAINAGSSSVKFAVFDFESASASGSPPTRALHGEIERIDIAPRLRAWDHGDALIEDRPMDALANPATGHEAALKVLFEWLAHHVQGQALCAVAHRVVHGGEHYTQPTAITPDVIEQLERLNSWAPLHQPHNLSAMRAVTRLMPDLPQVACFDTGFHATQAWVARAFALPRRVSRAGVKRYGFHGLSYDYIASVLPTHLGPLADGRVVVAHLGNGASLCAMKGRKSVASTTGLTALDGLMMGTRCGSIDPGAVLHLMSAMDMTAQAVETLLYQQSGLLGVSGISGDMRTLEASSDVDAKAAIDLYVHYIARELGAMVATLGGLDALVFTAGIGEHSAAIRQRVCFDAAWLGIELDEDANARHGPCITTAHSRGSAWVIPTNEELMLAQHAWTLLTGGSITNMREKRVMLRAT